MRCYTYRKLAPFIGGLLFTGAQAAALDLHPISNPTKNNLSPPIKREASDTLDLVPIEDPGVLTHGHSLKREAPGFEAFDPTSSNSFFWGVATESTIYVANFTLHNEDPDEFILPIENFAKNLKSINCGTATSPMVLEFNDQDSFTYARNAWDWVNQEDDNKFTVVTKPNQCFEGDDRTPYLVYDIAFSANNLQAKLSAKERQWGDIAHTFRLTLSHETLDPNTVNITHPHLKSRATKTMDLTHSFNQNLFHYGNAETNGLEISADAQINTGGQIIADLDIEYSWFIPKDLKINIHPAGVHGDLLLSLTADGKLGSPIDWSLKPEIEIPVAALNIKGILEIGPFVTMGVHFGSSAIEGHAKATVGARATIDDSAVVEVKLRHPDDNQISGWTPHFEMIDPTFTASLTASMKAWAELGIMIKAEALGRWGYQASLDAQLPYFEAKFAAKVDSNGGICGTTKTAGVDIDTSVGIDVNLNAGEVDKSPSFVKDLFQTSWPLYSTCFAFGPDVAASTSAPATVLPSETSVDPTPISTPGPATELSSAASSSNVEAPSTGLAPVSTVPPVVTSSSVPDPSTISSAAPSDSASVSSLPFSGTADAASTIVSSSIPSDISLSSSTPVPTIPTSIAPYYSSSPPSLSLSSSSASKAVHEISDLSSLTTLTISTPSSSDVAVPYTTAEYTPSLRESSTTPCNKSKSTSTPTSSGAYYVTYTTEAPIYSLPTKSIVYSAHNSTSCTGRARKSTLSTLVRSTSIALY